MKNFQELQKHNKKLIKKYEKLISKEYIKAFEELDVTLRDVYDKYEVNGMINLDELLKYNRMKKLEVEATGIMLSLYAKLDKIINKTLKEILETTKKESVVIIENRESLRAISKSLDSKGIIEKSVAGRTWKERTKHHRDNFIYDANTIIRKGLENGDSYTTIKKELKKQINKDIKRPEAIIRTEAKRIHEEVKYETLSEIKGVTLFKTWHNVGDERVRDTHQIMEGVTVGIEEEFTLPSGDRTLFPGGSGNPSEDINCRCYVTYDYKI